MNFPHEVLLHDHLDGSYPLLSVLPELHRLSDKKYPLDLGKNQEEEIKKWFGNPDEDIVVRFSIATGVMQNPETLALAAEAYTKKRAEQGFKYCEATIAPQYHTYGGLDEAQVVSHLIEGIKRGENAYPGIEVNILFTIGREVPAEEGVRLVNVADKCDRDYVVGIGLACDEGNNPPEKHKDMFTRAKEVGFKTTAHAGEWTNNDNTDWYSDFGGRANNIRTALFNLNVDRIGHAMTLAYDQRALRYVVDNKIGVEGCPASNLLSEYMPDTSILKIRDLLNRGVLYSLNPDDDLFLPDLDKTFEICNRDYNFTESEMKKMVQNAWDSRFGERKRAASGI